MEKLSVSKERVYASPSFKVWKALTDKTEMKKWYFDVPDFEPVTGFIFEFYGGDLENNPILHRCEILEVIPEKKLVHTWTYPEMNNASSVVTWELFAEGDQTRVVVTHNGIEHFPQDQPSFNVSSFNQGWTAILTEMLEGYLAS